MSASKYNKGLTVIELMVSIVISIVIGLAALSYSYVFMAMQRQSNAVNIAVTNISTVFAALKVELSHAGLGFYSNGSLLCSRTNLSYKSTIHSSNSLFLPIVISNTNGFSTIEVRYATELDSTAPASTSADALLTAGSLSLSTFSPAMAAETILIVPPAGVDLPCTFRTVDAVQTSTTILPQQISYTSSGIHNQVSFTDVNYPAGSRVFNYGQLQWTLFNIVNGKLRMFKPLTGTNGIIARNVVAFRAQYGITDGVNSTVSAWVDPEGEWASVDTTNINKIVAIRIGIISKAPQQEKPSASGTCTSTTTQPVLFDTTLALTGNWQCFRYRSSITIVPLRNMVYGEAP